MLAKQFSLLDSRSGPELFRECGGKDTTGFGAYPRGCEVTFRMEVPRMLGASAVVLRIARDGKPSEDLPLQFRTSSLGIDTYALTLRTSELSPADGGLLYYEFLFLRGLETLFTDSTDNVNFRLSKTSAKRFRLLIYSADFRTPDWFKRGTMYHIFLDRFRRGVGEVSMRKDAVLNEDWEGGIPPYPEQRGGKLKNNTFFGGNLWGVIEKLDDLADLGITVLYLSPIFSAASNHRYDTADYKTVDAFLGGEKAFSRLMEEAHKRGMKVILDGVFNHTGDNSIYFNRYGTEHSFGACQGKESPYYPWFSFQSYPDKYDCWWGIDILPRLNHSNRDCRSYFTSGDGIGAEWIKKGADGWRLDVADELPDSFLDEFRTSVKACSGGEAVIIGEVWENAADKMAYGKRRRYLRGKQLDSVMNYPFRRAVLELLQNRNTESFVRILTEIYASYPKASSDCLMNLLGTHDTVRILTALGDGGKSEKLPNRELAGRRLGKEDYAKALELLKIASALQFTVYGIPSVYYGDEAGLEGFHDPFCRMPYPWGRENRELLNRYRLLGRLRLEHPALQGGDFRFLCHGDGWFMYERTAGTDRVLVALNLSKKNHTFETDGTDLDYLTGQHCGNRCVLEPNRLAILVPPESK